MATKIILTEVGIEALINAQKNGTNALELSSVQFGSGKYTASETQTALLEPFKTLTTISGAPVGDNIIHISIRDTDIEEYTVNEIGVFTKEGVLFAVYAQDTPIIQKAANSYVLLSLDFPVVSAAAGDIVITGDTNFMNPPATTETQGVVELATVQEIVDGEDTTRAVTPKGVKKALEGFIAYDVVSDQDGVQLVIDTANSVTFSELQS
ncbi:phage tail-collar fiber domain-containing protein [Turicimonas sp. TL08]